MMYALCIHHLERNTVTCNEREKERGGEEKEYE
jgi:hypothetical protein